MRLNVFLSHNGAGSRRKTFELVQSARVSVNGTIVTEPSFDVDGRKDKIALDGREIKAQSYTYLMLNKSAGYVTTKSDPHAEKVVTDLLPPQFRNLQPVGRLDKDTEGLLLFTNDGVTAQKLLHPKFEKDKTYQVRVKGKLIAPQKEKLETGVRIRDKHTAPARIRIVQSSDAFTDCLMTIHEGKKRQIRLMMSSVGHPVLELKRLTFGPLELGTLKPGEWRLLTEEEISVLRGL
ncbi:MAG: pseudouridine synthase [Candidatus Omnitrophica bacterium CG12_big_fil_rev_8_21_14_0_65_50_5]|nr:MAG: pseudouridine synthase [Candidatus Omnitrophica bacterium CG12_big_fil_rev_8_21_14_0_65_50_5]